MDNKFIDFYTKKLLIIRIIWFAITIGIFILGVVLFIIIDEPFEMNLSPLLNGQDPLLIVCSLSGVILAVGTFQGFEMYRNRVIGQRWDRTTFLNNLKESRGEQGEVLYTASEIEYLSSLDNRSLGVFRLHTRLNAAYILRFALTEVIALFGFVVANQYSNISLFMPFGAVALILMLIYFPKSEVD